MATILIEAPMPGKASIVGFTGHGDFGDDQVQFRGHAARDPFGHARDQVGARH